VSSRAAATRRSPAGQLLQRPERPFPFDQRLFTQLEERLPEVKMHLPEATYLAWLDCRGLQLGQAPGSFFRQHARVALNDGAAFGPGFEGFVRLNFATSAGILDEILERMVAAVRAR
jgi:cysteine-S-conjugate beta-lyase